MKTKRREVGTCPKNVLVIFLFVLLIIFLFIPYSSVHIRYKLDAYSLIKYKTTTHQSGYMFLFQYLKLKSNGISQSEADQDLYSFKTNLFLTEIGLLILLTILDYFVFCILLRRRRTGNKRE
jgi:di/tricarboxylate transporter